MEYQKVRWPFPRRGLHTYEDVKYIPPDGLAEALNFYYPSPDKIRSRGGTERLYLVNGRVQCMYYWDNEDRLYCGTTDGLYRTAGRVVGSRNVTDIVGWGCDTPTLVVCDDRGAGDTLYRFDPTDAVPYQTVAAGVAPEARKIMVRKDRLFATCVRDHPHRIYYSEPGDATEWVDAHGQAGWVEIAPGEDGEIVDWVDHDGVLYIFKERGVYRFTGDEPRTYMQSRVEGADGVIPGSIADCGNVILYATATGVYPVGKGQMGVPRSFSLNVENELLDDLANDHISATYSEALNCYILVSGETRVWVCNLSARPDVWTMWRLHWTASTYRPICFVYARSDLWLAHGHSGGSRIFRYHHDWYQDAGVTFYLYLWTGAWDLGTPEALKNVRMVGGEINRSDNSDLDLHILTRDFEGSSSDVRVQIEEGDRQIARVNANCERIQVRIEYENPTGSVEFGWLDLFVVEKGDIL